VLHACEPEQAAAIADALRERRPDAEVIESAFEASMVVHTGPALIGVAWWWDPEPGRGGTDAGSR
jgi:fatty acid-binding protein DegV